MDTIPTIPLATALEDPVRVQEALSGVGVLVVSDVTQTPEATDSFRVPLTRLMTVVGTPITVYERHGLWKPIGVRLGDNTDRVQGVAEIPPHIDLVNASDPPDYVLFYCQREDAFSGGASTIASFKSALSLLDPQTRAALDSVWIREGAFFDLANVGVELSPFPLLQYHGDRLLWTRFTGKRTFMVESGSERALLALNRAINEVSRAFRLEAGSAFIVNQHLNAHGRLRLSSNQPLIPDGHRRLLWQVFIRSRRGD